MYDSRLDVPEGKGAFGGWRQDGTPSLGKASCSPFDPFRAPPHK